MIICKAQGQSLKEFGIDLRKKLFFLHMWFSQKLVLQMHMLAPTGKTTDVVYNQVLCWIFIIGTYNN
jgi:hypothetical protein